MYRIIDLMMFTQYGQYLFEQEKSRATIEKYTRAVENFAQWLKNETVEKSSVIAFKQHLKQHHAPAGVNGILAGINGFLKYMAWDDCVVKPLKVQRRVFASPDRELNRNEYERLLQAANGKGDDRLALLLQLMASTGIRVSEIRYVTVESLLTGCVCIDLKGKVRTVLMPKKLCRKLKEYQRACGIQHGPLFLNQKGRCLDRKVIWAQMKKLCNIAGVLPGKVFPHNLRHLFARAFYRVQQDIAKLADVLGHSSIETTRIYLLTSGTEHQLVLEKMEMIL